MKNSMVLMTEGRIEERVIRFAIPILLSNLLQQLYNTLDTIVVGRYVGSTALAAVGSTGALTNLIIGFFIGLSTGAGVVVAQFYGAKTTKSSIRQYIRAWQSAWPRRSSSPWSE